MEASFNINSLVGIKPQEILLVHGPTKLLIDDYHWFDSKVGVVASYTPKPRDVHDHFGLFRGVDQIEAFAQATIVSCGTFIECHKQNCLPVVLKKTLIPAFISIGNVNFHHYLEEGETFICIGKIKLYKFRQMVVDGRIYKVPKDLDLTAYFSDFNENRLSNYDLGEGFILIAELYDITGRALKKSKILINN